MHWNPKKAESAVVYRSVHGASEVEYLLTYRNPLVYTQAAVERMTSVADHINRALKDPVSPCSLLLQHIGSSL